MLRLLPLHANNSSTPPSRFRVRRRASTTCRESAAGAWCCTRSGAMSPSTDGIAASHARHSGRSWSCTKTSGNPCSSSHLNSNPCGMPA
ncbi:hypothetical protein [Lentzea sp. NPDC055074]